MRITFFIYMYILILFIFRGEGKEKEGEKYQCVVASRIPCHWGPGPQPRHVPRLGFEPMTLWFTAHAQCFELHQSGWINYFLKSVFCFTTRKGSTRGE